MQIVKEMHKNMTTLFSELIEFYCLDPKKTNMEELFGLIYNFLTEYQVSNVNEISHYVAVITKCIGFFGCVGGEGRGDGGGGGDGKQNCIHVGLYIRNIPLIIIFI